MRGTMQRKTNLPSIPRGGAVQSMELEGTFSYVYSIGRFRVTFPSYDVEKEYQQLLTPDDTRVASPEEQRYSVLRRPENAFLLREMVWLFEIQNVTTYRLQPRSSLERQAMLDALLPRAPAQSACDVIIGVKELSMDETSELPTVVVNRLYHFTAETLIKSAPRPPSIVEMTDGPLKEQYEASFQALAHSIFQDMLHFQDMLQLADDTGDPDEHRALNYVSLKCPDIYALNWQGADFGSGDVRFTGVEVMLSPQIRTRKVMDVIFNYTNSTGMPSRYCTSVDVNGQFPFLVTRFQPVRER